MTKQSGGGNMNMFAEALANSKKEAPKKKTKSSMEEIYAPDHVKDEVDRLQKAKQAEKEAKAEKEAAGVVVREFANKHQDTDGFNGYFRNAYKIDGHTESVKYVSSNRFSINPTDAKQIRELLGDAYEELIEEKSEVKLKEAVFKDPELQKVLMEAVKDNFGDFFETTTTIKVREDFDKNIYKVVAPEHLPILRTFCRPYKASLR